MKPTQHYLVLNIKFIYRTIRNNSQGGLQNCHKSVYS